MGGDSYSLRGLYDHKNEGCPDLKDSIYMTPTSYQPYDPLQLKCHLAEQSGRVFFCWNFF